MSGLTLEPVTLAGRTVRLEPAEPAHIPGLVRAGGHEEIWRWFPVELDTEETVTRVLEQWDARAAAGAGLLFTTRALPSDEIVGGTSFLNADPANARIEIGFTWITPAWQRTAINTEGKLLMLRHAFDALGCVRVEFKTDARNTASRNAIARLGALEEGTLRQHMRRRDGTYRDSVYFSIVRDEWPAVETALVERVKRGAA